jgi:hypothetical protein
VAKNANEVLDQWARHTSKDRGENCRDSGPENLALSLLGDLPALHPFQRLERFGIG